MKNLDLREFNRRKFIKRGALFLTGAAAFDIFVPRLIRASPFTDNVTQYLGAQPPAIVTIPNPSGWWKLAGNGNDSSGNGATLSFTGTQTYVTGQQSIPDTAYAIGGGSYASVAASACNNWTSFSLSFWFYETACGGNYGRFFEKGANNEITCGGNFGGSNCTNVNVQQLGSTSINVQDNSTSQNTWCHFCTTATAGGTSTQTLYINGVSIQSASSPQPASTTHTIYLGTYGGSPGSDQMIGYLQDVRFWNGTVLTSAQAARLAVGAYPAS